MTEFICLLTYEVGCIIDPNFLPLVCPGPLPYNFQCLITVDRMEASTPGLSHVMF